MVLKAELLLAGTYAAALDAPRLSRRARDAHDILKHGEILCQINQRLDEGTCRSRGLPALRRFIAAIMMLLQTALSSALMAWDEDCEAAAPTLYRLSLDSLNRPNECGCKKPLADDFCRNLI